MAPGKFKKLFSTWKNENRDLLQREEYKGLVERFSPHLLVLSPNSLSTPLRLTATANQMDSIRLQEVPIGSELYKVQQELPPKLSYNSSIHRYLYQMRMTPAQYSIRSTIQPPLITADVSRAFLCLFKDPVMIHNEIEFYFMKSNGAPTFLKSESVTNEPIKFIREQCSYGQTDLPAAFSFSVANTVTSYRNNYPDSSNTDYEWIEFPLFDLTLDYTSAKVSDTLSRDVKRLMLPKQKSKMCLFRKIEDHNLDLLESICHNDFYADDLLLIRSPLSCMKYICRNELYTQLLVYLGTNYSCKFVPPIPSTETPQSFEERLNNFQRYMGNLDNLAFERNVTFIHQLYIAHVSMSLALIFNYNTMQFKSFNTPYRNVTCYLKHANPFLFKRPEINLPRPTLPQILSEIQGNSEDLEEENIIMKEEEKEESLKGLGRITQINSESRKIPKYRFSIIKKDIAFKLHSKGKKVFRCPNFQTFETFIQQNGLSKRQLCSILHNFYDCSGVLLALPILYCKLALRATIVSQDKQLTQLRLWDESAF